MTASGTTTSLARIAAIVLIALGTSLVVTFFAGSDLAQAQSSVRPPASAVLETGPVEGRVPGDSLGNTSDADTWRKVRQGIQGTVSIPDKKAGQLIQSEGENWRARKNGPISSWGAYGLIGILVVLTLFYLYRGKVRIQHGLSGKTVLRFNDIERMAHWLVAVSFIILALTGLNITYGKHVLMPVIGKEAFATIAAGGKWLHNYVAFAFIVGLVMIIVLWTKNNIWDKYDGNWIIKGGGLMLDAEHPPAAKFNFGQKLIFWSVVLGGIALSVTGLALMFPFQIGFPIGMEPIQQMQFMASWHAIIALPLIILIFAHIYIGTIGMQGAFDAMGTGEVDLNWAKEHHAAWVAEMQEAETKTTKPADRGKGEAAAAPAE